MYGLRWGWGGTKINRGFLDSSCYWVSSCLLLFVFDYESSRIGIWSKFLKRYFTRAGKMINDKQKLSLKTCHNKSFFTFITLTLAVYRQSNHLVFLQIWLMFPKKCHILTYVKNVKARRSSRIMNFSNDNLVEALDFDVNLKIWSTDLLYSKYL